MAERKTKEEEYKILSNIAKEENFPLDSLIAMYMVESSGDSQVVNELGYTGGFQFGKKTGEEYGLVGEGFDHRKDLGKSAKASIKMSKRNMKNTGDWKKFDINKRLKNLNISQDLAAYLTHQQGRGGTIDIITGASSGKIRPITRERILGNIGTSTKQKVKNMGDKDLVNAYLDFWRNTWQTKGVEGGKKWTDDAQVNTNIAFSALEQAKKKDQSVMGRVINSERTVIIQEEGN